MNWWICPFCGGELIFTGKRLKNESWQRAAVASFYACNCKAPIISKAFKNKDGTPKIFYSNKWQHLLDGRWRYWNEGSWGTPKSIPIKNKKERVNFT